MISLGSLLNVWGPGVEGSRELYSGWWKHRCLLTLCSFGNSSVFSLLCPVHGHGLGVYKDARVSLCRFLELCYWATVSFPELWPTDSSSCNLPKLWLPSPQLIRVAELFGSHLPVREVCKLPLGRCGVIGGKGDSYVSLLSVPFVPCLKTVIFIYFVQFASCCLQWEVKYGPCNSFMAGCGSAVNVAGSICMIIYY